LIYQPARMYIHVCRYVRIRKKLCHSFLPALCCVPRSIRSGRGTQVALRADQFRSATAADRRFVRANKPKHMFAVITKLTYQQQLSLPLEHFFDVCSRLARPHGLINLQDSKKTSVLAHAVALSALLSALTQQPLRIASHVFNCRRM
jgi:hypothetical protein